MAFIDFEYTINYWKDVFGIGKKLPVSPIASSVVPSLDSILNPAKNTVSPLINPNPVNISEFDPELILTDSEFCDCNSMSENQVQEFLVSKGSFLKDYKINNHLTSYWIKKHCDEQGLSPQVLISHIQKEQASISQKTIPTRQIKLDYILGVGAYNNPLRFDEKYRGVDKQIWGAVLVCTKWYKKSLGLTYPLAYISEKPEFRNLNIKNASTRSLYYYTPFVGDKELIIDGTRYSPAFGNFLFYKIYTKWFK